MLFQLNPVAYARNKRANAIDDDWGQIISEIELAPQIPTESLMGIEAFSHLEIIYIFDKADPAQIVFSGHPRGNTSYPMTGIFAQRKKDRPNHLGLCTVELLEVKGRILKVKYLDAIDGTSIVDIKPVMREFEPVSPINQPAWATQLMQNYW